jgi:hypothetical protein
VWVASDELKDENTSEKASFAELFEFYGEGLKEDVQVGDKNRGKIKKGIKILEEFK